MSSIELIASSKRNSDDDTIAPTGSDLVAVRRCSEMFSYDMVNLMTNDEYRRKKVENGQMSSGSCTQSSPRSFDVEQLLRAGGNGSVSFYAHPEGRFFVVNTPKAKESIQIRLDDVYAVFRNELELKLETCPRLVGHHRSPFKSKLKPHRNPYKRGCQTHVLQMANDIEVEDWYAFIRHEITPTYTHPLVEGGERRRLLVVVNPIGGSGRGEEIFRELLKPMLEDAGTPHEMIVTTGPGHAETVAKTFNVQQVGAIAVVGGDGLFGEFLNGMNAREDRLAALSLPLGVVPAGSSNCLACSVGLRQPLSAAFSIARGHTKPLDVLKVSLAAANRVILSVCGVSYGFISEVNTFAGKWRWLFGPARYTVCGLRTIMSSPMEYHVDCRYRGPETDDPEFDKIECGPDCVACVNFAAAAAARRDAQDPATPHSPDAKYTGMSFDNSPLHDSVSVVDPGSSGEGVDEGPWTESAEIMEPKRRKLKPKVKVVDASTMLLFSITNLSIRQSQNRTVWNSRCHMASGYMDLVMMPVMSRLELLGFLSKFSKGGDLHKEDPAVFSVIKARSVEMRVTNIESFPEWEKAIQLAIDGETFPLQPLRVDTLHGFLNLMCS